MGGKDSPWGILKAEGDQASIEEIGIKIIEKNPIELEEKIETLSRPLIIECAYPGWQPRRWPPGSTYGANKPSGFEEGGVRYPAVPTSMEEQVGEIIKAARAGCAVAHIHPRDPKDTVASSNLALLAEVYNRVLEQVDVISFQHTWKIAPEGTIDYIGDAEALLEAGGGNRFCQGAVVMWPPSHSYPPAYTKSVQAAVRFMEEHNIRPVQKVRSTYNVRQMKRALLDSGVLAKGPVIIVHDMGHPFGWPLDIDPWMSLDMIASLMQTRQRVPGALLGVASGGRNWLPITVTAILAGVDFIRVGIEDCYWMYPHLDEVIQRNMDCVEKILQVCRALGRRVASVDEAREIMGVTRTS